MPAHRQFLEGYGLPLPARGVGRVASRARKIPQILSKARAVRQSAPRRAPQPQPAPQQLPENLGRRRKNTPLYHTSDPRQVMGLIQMYARGRKTVKITYLKVTDGTTVVREVEPYSIRLRPSRSGGMARYFYAYCLPHGSIHMFLIQNIQRVEGTSRNYVPRWVVEL